MAMHNTSLNFSSVVADTGPVAKPVFLDPSYDSTVPVVIIMSVLTVFANLGTIVAFYTDPTVRTKPSDLIILNLACADMGVGLFIMPRLAFVKSVGRWVFGEMGCRINYMLESTLINAGMYFIILLSFDRYKMLALDYTAYVKRYNYVFIRKAVFLTWVAASLQGFVENCMWNYTIASLPVPPPFHIMCARPSLFKKAGTTAGLVMVIITILMVALLGIRINLKLIQRLQMWKRVGHANTESIPNTLTTGITLHTLHGQSTNNSQVMHAAQDGNGTSSSVHSQENPNVDIVIQAGSRRTIRKRYIKPIVTYTALVLSLLICSIPLNAASVMKSFCKECIITYFLLSYLWVLVLFNSCINPILYALTNAKIRAFYRRQLSAMLRTIAQ